MELFEYLSNNKDIYFSSEYFLQISTIEKEIDEHGLNSIERLINEIDSNEDIEILDTYYESEILNRNRLELSPYEFRHYSLFNNQYKLKEDCYIVFKTDINTYDWLIKNYESEILTLQLINGDLIKHSNKIKNVLESKMIKSIIYETDDFTYYTHINASFLINDYLMRHQSNKTHSFEEIEPIWSFNTGHLNMFDLSEAERTNSSLEFIDGLRTSSSTIDEMPAMSFINIDSSSSIYLSDSDGDSVSHLNINADSISTSFMSPNANWVSFRADDELREMNNRIEDHDAVFDDFIERIRNLEDWRDNHDNQGR